MPTLGNQVRHLAHTYVRHGGKQNRRQQVDRIATAVDWIQEKHRLTGLEQIGKRQVIDFWKAHRDLAPRTAYSYWLGFCELWNWIGRTGEPPRPRA